MRRLARSDRGSPEWREAALSAVDADRERRVRFNSAIALTLEAYKIGPTANSGTIVNGPFSKNKMTANWRPRFEPNELVARKVSDGDIDHYLYFEPKKNQFGDTWEDGEVFIRSRVFFEIVERRNPGALAYILHHEAFHFSRLITTGWDTKQVEEEAAYKSSLSEAHGFELDEVQIGYLKSIHREYLEHVWAPIYPIGPASHSLFHDERQDKENEMRYLRQEERNRLLAEARGFVSSEPGVRRQAAVAPIAVRPEKPAGFQYFNARAAAAQLVDLARAACAGAAGKTRETVVAVNRWFPDQRSSLPIADWMGLSGCSYDLYIWIRNKNSMAKGYHLNAEEILRAAGQFRAENYTPARPAAPLPDGRSTIRQEEPVCSVQSGVRGCPR